MNVLQNISKLAWIIVDQARKWLTLIVFVLMLGFTFATHTVEFLANMTSQVIQVTSSLAGSSDETKSRASSTQIRPSSTRTDTKTPSSVANVPPIDADRRLDAAVIEELAQNNLDLKNQTQLDEQTIVDLRSSETALQRRVSLLDSQIAEHDARILRMRHRSTDVLSGIQERTRKTAAVNFGSMFGEAIPVYGIAIVVGATTFEIASACDTMNDLYELQVELNPNSAIPDDRDEVCGLEVPTKEELWEQIKASPRAAWEASIASISSTSNWAANIETPDFAGGWANFMTWEGSFFWTTE